MPIKQVLYIILLFGCVQLSSQTIEFTAEEQAWILDHPVIEFGNDPNKTPYEIIEDGEYTGIINEFILEIENETGIDMIPIMGLSWTETLNGVKDGSIKVVSNAARTHDRLSYLEFTKPYMTDPYVIVTRKDFEFIGSLEDLEEKTITVPENYFSIEVLTRDYPLIDIIVGENVEDCLKKLSYGEVDAFVGALGLSSYFINNKGFTNLKIAAPTSYQNIQISLAVAKDWKIFAGIAEKVFETISNERKAQLKKEWISVRYDHGITWKEAFYWIGLIIGISLAVFAFFYIWNRSLLKQVGLRIKSQELLTLSLNQVKQQDDEKKLLLQEIHRRVKNNLRIISSLIHLQASNSTDQKVVNSLNESVERIKAIALIHDKIYQSTDLDHISTQTYVESLVNEIASNLSSNKKVDLEVNPMAKTINLKSIVPLALILNELITNSMKHGLINKDQGKISIDLNETEKVLSMRYFDNGKWIKKEPKSNSLGTSLIDIFTDQLDGTYQLNKLEFGTEYIFTFKAELH